jgi:quinohemoprotein ethanol dehydrogenase
MAYDPETDTIFFGTGNVWPANHRVRSADRGDTFFVASFLALQRSTGKYRWHYQMNPGDTWD